MRRDDDDILFREMDAADRQDVKDAFNHDEDEAPRGEGHTSSVIQPDTPQSPPLDLNRCPRCGSTEKRKGATALDGPPYKFTRCAKCGYEFVREPWTEREEP